MFKIDFNLASSSVKIFNKMVRFSLKPIL